MESPDLRALKARLVTSFSLMSLVGAVATLGYYLLWRSRGGTLLDAVYMTVITMTTIGFQEVKPLGTAGRLLTMGVAISGVGSLFYLLSAMMDYAVSGQIQGYRERRRMQKQLEELQGHVVIAGLGRVGREAAREMADGKVPFVIIDTSAQAQLYAAERDYPFILGDSTSDEVLQRAGIQRARGLIVTTDSDATNMYVVMSARLLNPKLYIVSRAVDQASVPKLLRAGANQAISPYAIGGRRLAHLILSPTVIDFFETALTRGNTSLNIEEIVIAPGATATTRRLEELRIPQTAGATLLAVIRDGNTLVNPPGDLVLSAGDHLLALGTGPQLESLARLLA